ncbi:hypothetical protein [Rhodococcus phenolicus]|uniref:hypothetical protein n=1 Tax=Rhodococcus phenolicus TaxID=263849 RepID=UPI000A6E5F9A|nr:hypothetical protein [Rhodococcus phenolicus]
MTRADDTGPGHEVRDIVDDLERKVERERDERDVPGSRSDREDVEPVDTGDDAPD